MYRLFDRNMFTCTWDGGGSQNNLIKYIFAGSSGICPHLSLSNSIFLGAIYTKCMCVKCEYTYVLDYINSSCPLFGIVRKLGYLFSSQIYIYGKL